MHKINLKWSARWEAWAALFIVTLLYSVGLTQGSSINTIEHIGKFRAYSSFFIIFRIPSVCESIHSYASKIRVNSLVMPSSYLGKTKDRVKKIPCQCRLDLEPSSEEGQSILCHVCRSQIKWEVKITTLNALMKNLRVTNWEFRKLKKIRNKPQERTK